jgi:hypothetical protein
VTAADALYRQPPTPQSAMAADGFRGVLGATGREPAVVAQEGAEKELVGPDKELKQPRHGCKSACFCGSQKIENLPSGSSSAIKLQFLFRAFCLELTKNNKKQHVRQKPRKRMSQGVA